MENKDTIADALGVAPLDQEILPAEVKPIIENNTAEDDFEVARNNLLNIIDKGNTALDGILSVADQSQHPRSYEVVSTLIKTLADANKDLLDLSKKKKEIIGRQEPQTINNNLFVGSTAELQKMLKNGIEE